MDFKKNPYNVEFFLVKLKKFFLFFINLFFDFKFPFLALFINLIIFKLKPFVFAAKTDNSFSSSAHSSNYDLLIENNE